MSRKSFDEVIKERKKAKESGTYNAGTTFENSKKRNADSVMAKRRQSIADGTYGGSPRESVKTQFPTRVATYHQPRITNPSMTYQEFKRQEMGKSNVGANATKSMDFSALTNDGYRKYLDNIKQNASEGKQWAWLREQEKNLSALQEEKVRKYVSDIVTFDNGTNKAYAGKAYEASKWLEKNGYSAEDIASLKDTYKREQNAERTMKMEQKVDAETGNFWENLKHSIGSVGAGLVSGFGFMENMRSFLDETFTGEYSPVDTNATGYYEGAYRDRVRQNVTEDIYGEKQYTEEDMKNLEILQDKSVQNYIETAIPFFMDGNKAMYKNSSEAYRKLQDMGYTAEEINSLMKTYRNDGISAWKKGLGDVYNAGMSVADIGANMGVAGLAGLAGAGAGVVKALPMANQGLSAASGTSKDVFERTGSSGKALATGALAGGVEAATEKVSLDNLWDMVKGQGKAVTRGMVTNVLAQMGIEGSEELTAEAANEVIDRVINGEDSNYELNVKNYINNGMSEEEARKQANSDFMSQLGQSFTLGALAGGMGGGIGAGSLAIRERMAGSDAIKSGSMDSVLKQAETYQDERVQKALKQYQDNPSEYAAGKLMYEMNSVDEIQRNLQQKESQGSIFQKMRQIVSKGQNEGEKSTKNENSVDVEASMKRISSAANAEELVESMREVEAHGSEEQIRTARTNYEYQSAKMISTGQISEMSLRQAENQLTEEQAYEMGKTNQEVQEEQLSLKGKSAYKSGRLEYLREQVKTNTISERKDISNASALNANGQSVQVYELETVEGEPTVKTSQGTISLKDVSFANAAVQTLYNNASTKGTTEAAKTYIEFYPAGIMVNAYDGYFDRFVKAGEIGLSFENVINKNAFLKSYIGEKGLRKIYELGQEKKNALEREKQEIRTVKKKGAGKVIDKRLDKTADPLMKVYEKIAEKTGQDIILKDKDLEGINGYFNQTMSEIVLNTESEHTYATLIHEAMGEFSEAWNGKEMQQFQEALLEWYFETQGEERMHKVIDKYQEVYAAKEGSKSQREAANEMINDALAGLFATEEGTLDFANWLYENKSETEAKTILDKIVELIQEICDKIFDYLTNHEMSSVAKASMQMEAEKATELRKQFLKIVDKASENYQKAEVDNRTKETEKKYSLNKFGFEAYTEREIKNFSNGRTFFANTEQDIADYVKEYVHKKPYSRILIGKIGTDLAERIFEDTGVDVANYNVAITSEFENSHTKEEKERSRGQMAITPEIVAKLPELISEYDKATYEGYNKQQQKVLKFEKNIDGRKIAIEYVSKGRKTIDLQTMYGWENKKEKNSHQASYANAHDRTFKTDLDMSSSNTSISENEENTIKISEIRHSLSDASDLDYFWEAYDGFEGVINNSASILEEGAKVLQGKEVDKTLVRRIARKVKKDYSSAINEEVLTDNLVKVFSYMQTQDKANYEDMVRVMSEVALPIVEDSRSYNEAEMQQYQSFKRNLKGMRIKLSEQQKKEVEYYYGSYENFRKRMFGTLILANDGEYLDNVWSEIAGFSNGYLDEEANYVEQPVLLMGALEMMKPQLQNNFGADNKGVAMDLALQIYEEYFKAQADLRVKALHKKMVHERVEWHTKVRKQYYEKLAAEKKKMKEKAGTINARVAEVRAAHTASELSKKEKERAAKYRNNIKRTGAQLIGWIEKPTDKNHVPEALKGLTLEFLSSIDFISHRALDGSTSTKRWQEKMRAISDELNTAVAEEDFEQYGSFLMDLDPDFLPEMKEFLKQNDSVEKISLLGSTELEKLNRLMSSLKRAITKANEFHLNDNYKNVSKAAMNTIRELKDKNDKRPHNEAVEMADKMLNIDMIDPLTYFEMMGEGAKSIYGEIRKGFNKRTWHLKEAQDYMKKVLNDVDAKELKKWTGDGAEVHEFQVRDGKIKLTTGQIMSLYLLGKRGQAKRHILSGGVVASTVGKGSKRIMQYKAKHMTEKQYNQIVSVLTKDQKAVADKMQRFLAVNCASWGNETSMLMYGYKKFLDNRYFPIKSYTGQIRANDKNSSEASLWTIKNQGMTKSLVKDAKNAIMAEDIMDVFVNHVVGMANYNAFAAPLSDAMKWYNFKNEGMEGEFYEADTIQEEITRVYSKKANDYFIQLIKDINGEVSNVTSTEVSDMLLANYKAAAVGANLRVAIQQPTAYARASLVLEPVDMLNGLAHKPNIKKAKENSAIALWKTWGYYETSMGRSMKQVITGQRSIAENIRDKTSVLAQLGDEVTWGYLWNACESEVKRKNKELDVNSKEFTLKVAERFDEVVDQTQVVDTVLHKSQIMRSKKGSVMKMEMSFMSEPQKSYNMLYRAGKQGKKQFAKAAMVYAMTGVFTSLAAAILDSLRDDDFEKEFGDKLGSHIKENIKDNLNPFGMIPYVKDIISYINGYEAERTDMAGVANLVTTGQMIYKHIFSDDSKKTTYGVVKSSIRAASQISGIPMYNLLRDTEAFVEYILQEKIGEKKATNSELYKKLFTHNSEGDTEKYNETYDKLLEKEIDEEEIVSGVRSEIRKMYKEGSISESDVKDALREWGMTEAEIYWKLQEWNGGEEYSKYNEFYVAVDEEANLESVIDNYMDHGVSAETLSGRITAQYKEEYINLYYSDGNKAAQLKEKLLRVYEALGYDRAKKEKTIDRWLEE